MSNIRHNPSFYLFPLNNARTGYKPFAIPVIYIEPHRIDQNGNGIQGSETLRIRYYVVNAPDPAKVAGPFNTNIRIPDQSLFEIEVTSIQLYKKKIEISHLTFYDANGNIISYIDAKEGDSFSYTLNWTIPESSPTTLVPYYPDAYYYDISNISIDVAILPKPKTYLFIWEATFFRRYITANGDFKCVSNETAISNKILTVNHPGDVHEFLYNGTPQVYFSYDNFVESTDPTLEFYRPFADILQDVFDEQTLLDGINQINTIRAEYIPYLSYLIGWDLPNFPGSNDNLRRQILRRAVELQKIKGTKRAITELFGMFGYIVDIVNLYASLNGDKYLSAEDGLEARDVIQTDLILSNYNAEGFGIGNVPLTYRASRDSDIILYAYLVTKDSTAYNQLVDISTNLSDNLEYYNSDLNRFNLSGSYEPSFIPEISNSDIIGTSVVNINKSSTSNGRPVLNSNNISYDNIKNIISLYFDHELSVDENVKVFIFATYKKFKIIIPNYLSNTVTNKFDVSILDQYGKSVDFNLLLFLLNFLFKLKAFHSILRKIKVTITQTEVYNVTDLCINGNDEFAPGSTLGEFQISPAVIPTNTIGCDEDTGRGFKESDLLIRKLIINGLEEEFQSWKLLADDCSKTKYGQDKVISKDIDLDHHIDDRETLCDENVEKKDYCYKRRVVDNFGYELVIPNTEYFESNHCSLKLGKGVYWESSDGLHYCDRPYYYDGVENTKANDLHNLVITKDNLNYPSCRFLTMNRLENDYNYTIIAISQGILRDTCRRRPWDNISRCDLNYLNATLVESTVGQELIWDDEDLVYIGNGLVSDISSLDVHSINVGRIIVNDVFQVTEQLAPAISLDCTIISDETIDLTGSGINPIFKSACGNIDYKGGYPSSYNLKLCDEVRYEDGDTSTDYYTFCDDDGNCFVGNINRQDIANGFGISHSPLRTDAIFFGSSSELIYNNDVQYRYYIPYRLDCDCAQVSCTDDVVVCNEDKIYSDEFIDVNCDRVDLIPIVTFFESIGMCSRVSNYDLANLFCLNDSCDIPSTGKFRYKDDYGIIYENEWVLMEDVIDITVITKDPRVPYAVDEGYIDDDGRIFKKGVISTVRQIIKIVDGSYIILAEGTDSVIAFFQVNVVCGDIRFENPFSYGIDCAVSDEVEFIVTGGPAWS